MGHSFGTLLWDTLVGPSCRTLLWDTLVGHSCGTLLWDTLVGHSCRAHSSNETSSKSHASSLKNERFVQDFLQKSHVKSPKRAFRTRLPPKVTRQVSKTSVSFETSSKSHMSSPQNERFVRDFLKLTCQSLQNDRFARDFLQKSSGNTHWSTHITPSCRTLLWDTPVGHSCGTLLWDTLVGHSCRKLLWDTLVGHSCGTLLRDTLVGHS